MKTRSGFVSNSSSSSFIVGFEKKPTTVSEMKQVVFGCQDSQSDFSDCCSTLELSDILLRDIKDQTPIDKEKCLEVIGSGHFPGTPKLEDFETPDKKHKIDWERYTSARNEAALEVYNKELKPYEGKLEFYEFEYEDHSRVGSCLEHGGTFEGLVHLCISKH